MCFEGTAVHGHAAGRRGQRVRAVGHCARPPRSASCGAVDDLVLRAQRGEEAAFAALVRRDSDRLHAVAMHILRDADAAADATQQALIEMWRKLPQLREPGAFGGWAYRIVVRSAYAEARRHRRATWRIPIDATEVDALPASDRFTSVDDRDQLDRAFGRLGLDHRAVIVLKHLAGLSDPEVAEVLDIPEGTVRSRHFHAIRSMRAAIDADRRDALEGST